MVWDISDVWKRRMGIVANFSKMADYKLCRQYKMVTGTQMVLEVKKNKLNNSSKWFIFGEKLDRS